MAVEIINVDSGSLADKAGIKSGMLLVTVNDNDINDVLDYGFYCTAEHLSVRFADGGRLFVVEFDKEEYEDIGLDFDTFLMDGEHSCNNECIFCFVDQLPHGLRESLYFKDDDDRLSYLFGNYLSLTNLEESEIDRIIKMRISPINISVHTTDPQLRCMMLRNSRAGEVLKYMKKLADAEIEMNCQIVVCRDINDGDNLRNTLSDLAALYPSVSSVAVVPVGLTKHREGLFPLEHHDADSAKGILAIVEDFGEQMLKSKGTRFVYPADEWFLLAHRDIPQIEYYEELPQYENGVGMLASLRHEFMTALSELHGDDRKVTTDIACGYAARDMITYLADEAKKLFPNIKYRVHAIRNDFFGEKITVSGLVVATDIKAQVSQNTMLSDTLFFPKCMLRSENDMFLDSVTVEQLSQAICANAVAVDYDGEALLELLLGISEADNAQ